MARTLPAVIAIVASLVVDYAWAAEPTGSKLLGDGIVAVYRGRNDLAIQQLDAAQAALPRDPRVYFFRGIAKWRQGMRWEAEADFRTGAHIEAALGRIDVGRSLHRIQGAERLAIESLRREARKLPIDVVQQAVPPLAQRPAVAARANRRVRGPVAQTPVPDNPDDSDPFSQESTGFLGRGEVRRSVPAASQIAADDPYGLRVVSGAEETDAPADDEPVGTGVAAFPDDDEGDMTTADVEPEIVADEDAATDIDPFSIDEADAPATPAADSPSIFGAAFRALTRGLAPTLPESPPGQTILERITGAGAPPDMNAPPAESLRSPAEVDEPATEAEDLGDPFQDE